jgi:hypothetical protein
VEGDDRPIEPAGVSLPKISSSDSKGNLGVILVIYSGANRRASLPSITKADTKARSGSVPSISTEPSSVNLDISGTTVRIILAKKLIGRYQPRRKIKQSLQVTSISPSSPLATT